MRSEEILGAIGANYLDGQISRIWVDSKFCILDNMEYDSTGEYEGSSRLRFPLKTSLTVCVFCKSGKISVRIQQKDYLLESGSILVIFGGQILEQVNIIEACRVIIVGIDSEYIMTEMRSTHGRSLRQWVLHNQEPALASIDEEEAENYEKLCQSLKFIVKNSDESTSDGILSGFTYIFASLLLKWRKRSVAAAGTDSDKVNAEATDSHALGYSREKEVLYRFQEDIHNFQEKTGL